MQSLNPRGLKFVLARASALAAFLFRCSVIAQSATALPSGFSAKEALTELSPGRGQSFIIAADDTPLGGRTPVLLIHGWNYNGTPAPSITDGWQNLISFVRGDKGFGGGPPLEKEIKIYLYAYPSNLIAVPSIGHDLAILLNNIGARDPEFEKAKIAVVAHSMGGLVARSFMEESVRDGGGKWNERILGLITLGTPHHGTPAANDYDGALGRALGRLNPLRPVQSAIKLAVSYANGKFPPYSAVNRSDLLWDNFDGLFTEGFSRGEQSPWLAQFNSLAETKRYDQKIIAYAGTISNGHLYTGTPEHDTDLRSVGTSLSDGLAIANDGIVPMESALFTGRLPNSQIRVFSDYDHYQMCQSKTNAQDDPLFSRIVGDLRNLVKQSPTHAALSPQPVSPPASRQITAQTIYADDFSANTVKGFLAAAQAKDASLAFRDILQQPSNSQRTLELLKTFLANDPALKYMTSFRLLTSRHDPPLARVVAETSDSTGKKSLVTFILRGNESDPEGESWEIDRIESVLQFPGQEKTVYEFRLHRWGYVALDISPGHEEVHIYGGDKETTTTALRSPLKRLGSERFTTPKGTIFTITKLAAPVINDGNRRINSGDWKLVVSGNGSEYQKLKTGHWLTASFGDTGDSTFYGTIALRDDAQPASPSGSPDEANIPSDENLQSLLIGKWMGHRHLTEYFPDGSFKWDGIADKRMRWRLEGKRLIQVYPNIPDYNGVYYPGPCTISFAILSLSQNRLLGSNENAAQFVEYKIEQDTPEARELAAQHIAADEDKLGIRRK
jgi:triacylglycerol esterase/lipase EstA (alpha/beta hydrolase family)